MIVYDVKNDADPEPMRCIDEPRTRLSAVPRSRELDVAVDLESKIDPLHSDGRLGWK
jgi:hypothetical protein